MSTMGIGGKSNGLSLRGPGVVNTGLTISTHPNRFGDVAQRLHDFAANAVTHGGFASINRRPLDLATLVNRPVKNPRIDQRLGRSDQGDATIAGAPRDLAVRATAP
ncbi:MAG: hypothetical protein ACRC2H_07725, partial [Silanimonas sp.]